MDEPTRRKYLLTLGATSAFGLAGCSEDITDNLPRDTATPAPDLGGANFEFTYAGTDRQLTVQFNGGARVLAGDLEIRSSTGLQVRWAELGSTVAGLEDPISAGSSAVLGERILNWGQAVGPSETIRLVHVGRETPATLGRYTPPGPSTLTSTVPQTATPTAERTPTATEELTATAVEVPTETPPAAPTTTDVEVPTETPSTEPTTTVLEEPTTTVTEEPTTAVTEEPTATPTPDVTAPSITAFSIANPSGRDLRISFESDEALATVQVSISGAEATTLGASAFSQRRSAGGYTYEATYQAAADGDYTATLETAADADGNDGASGQSVSLAIDTTTDTPTDSSLTTSISRANTDGDVYQIGTLESYPSGELTAGESVSATIAVDAQLESAGDNIVYGVLGTLGGDVYGIRQMDAFGTGTVTVSTALPSDAGGNELVWTWIPAVSEANARDKYSSWAADDRLDPFGPDQELSLGTIAGEVSSLTTSISRENTDGDVYQIGTLESYPNSAPAAGESVSVTIAVDAQLESAGDNIVYGALGTLGGDVYGIRQMDALGTGSVTVSTTLPADAAGNALVWTWIPAISETRARDKYSNWAADDRLDPFGPDQELSLGTIQNG